VKGILTLFFALPLFGCSAPEPTVFEVDAGEFKPTGAVLELYGVESPMEQNGKTLVGRRSVKSDGSGKIIVNFEGKPPIICHIGYVTNGLQYHFQYEIKNGQCNIVRMLQDEGAIS
jgi:hypothetical protein|tara:strand:- start:624 stop:971 length:348 start_codon:yes stop_codon:yes gene_type:complete